MFEVYGSLFFGAVDQFTESMRPLEKTPKVLILETQHLLAIDGFQAHTASSCAFAVAVLVLGAALLAPSYGIMGMACAVVVADFVWAGLCLVGAVYFTFRK